MEADQGDHCRFFQLAETVYPGLQKQVAENFEG